MEKTILIRLGEIFLKGDNRHCFIAQLRQNITTALNGLYFVLTTSQNRIFIERYKENDEAEIIERLRKVFGIYSISPAIKVPTDMARISELCSEIFPKKGKFRVTVNRADKRIPETSAEIAAKIGSDMLEKNPDLKVDLYNYDFDVSIDIRENSISYIFSDKIAGARGLPVGCGGNGMLLLSGGIDSPVAGYMMAKRGVKIHAIHFHSFPYTGENSKIKTINLAKKLSSFCGGIELSIAPFTEIQLAIKKYCPAEFMITLMRRFMMRIAAETAKIKKCGALITGESLGQVASQTMESIAVTDDAADLPVFRPLIGYDKEEIIQTAKNIGTYELSILPYEDCCTVFVPKHPVIHPKLSRVAALEKNLPAEELIRHVVESVETVVCNPEFT